MPEITIFCPWHGESPALLLDSDCACRRCHDEEVERTIQYTAPETEDVECPGCHYWKTEVERLEKLLRRNK